MSRFFRNIFQRQAPKSLLNFQLQKPIAINTVAAIILFIFMDSQSADTKNYFQPHIQSYFFVTYYYRQMLSLIIYKVCDDSSD